MDSDCWAVVACTGAKLVAGLAPCNHPGPVDWVAQIYPGPRDLADRAGAVCNQTGSRSLAAELHLGPEDSPHWAALGRTELLEQPGIPFGAVEAL